MGSTHLHVASPARPLTDVGKPHWLVALAVGFALLVWVPAWISIQSQVGQPFPGFFYSPEGVVSSLTLPEFTGRQAGLQPRDILLAVNGESWRELPRLVREAGAGGMLTYTIERGSRQLDIAVATMQFSPAIWFVYLPGYAASSLVFLLTGIFVYLKRPAASLNRYLLAYLVIWAVGAGIVWESYISQLKWLAYFLVPYAVLAPVSGWMFLWSFPADPRRREFLARWRLIRVFAVLAAVTIAALTLMRVAVYATGNAGLRHWYIALIGWPYFILFGLSSIPLKIVPLLLIALREGAGRLRQQAIVMLAGLFLGLTGWYLCLWTPAAVHTEPALRTWWAGLIPALYPLGIGYAILRYRLLDIRVAVRTGLVYSLLTAALAAGFVLFSLLSGYVFQYLIRRESILAVLIPALFVAFLFEPLRRRVQAFVDRAFFRREVEVRRTLTGFSASLNTLRSRTELVHLVRETVMRTLHAGDVTLWLRNGGGYAPAGANGPADRPLPLAALAEWLGRERRIFDPLLANSSAAAGESQAIGAALAVPLFSGDRLTGILALGARPSGDPYGQDDLELLTTLAHSAALALENARLHEEQVELVRRHFMEGAAIQEEERRRIAAELHDGVGPSLASISLRLRTVGKALERGRQPTVSEIEELAGQAQANIRDIRRLIYDLRPAALDELGLAPALAEYVAHFGADHGIAVALDIRPDLPSLPAPVETTLFRIAQEALANVAKHAQASCVEVSLACEPVEVVMRVADDGQGFDPAVPLEGPHLGLWSMRQRVEQFGGSLRVDSGPGRGTRVQVRIPLPHNGEGWS